MKEINVHMVIISSEPHHLSLPAALTTSTNSMAYILLKNEADRKT
jgi:hypothetical protein